MKEYFYIQNPFIVLPVDEFTEENILGTDFIVSIEGEKGPLQKRDGFYVFLGLTSKLVTVHLSGRGYQKEIIEIDRSQLNTRNPVVRILMKPDKSYLFPQNICCIEGTIPAGAVLSLAVKGRTFRKLLSDMDSGEMRALIFQKPEENLEMAAFYAVEEALSAAKSSSSGNLPDGEWIELYEQMESGSYRLKLPVSRKFSKKETKLYPGVRRYGGSSPTPYFVAVRGNPKEEYTEIVCCLETKDRNEIYKHTLKQNETLYLDF